MIIVDGLPLAGGRESTMDERRLGEWQRQSG